MGYYTQRNISELAGLINPEMIPIIRDETQLSTYFANLNVDYVIVILKLGWNFGIRQNQICNTKIIYAILKN
jgi:hypothetical protein